MGLEAAAIRSELCQEVDDICSQLVSWAGVQYDGQGKETLSNVILRFYQLEEKEGMGGATKIARCQLVWY